MPRHERRKEAPAQSRRIKIEEAGDFASGNTYAQIRLKGKWLRAAGFEPGNHVEVRFNARGVPCITLEESTVREIKLTRGKSAFVDARDFERVSQFKWCFASTGYAVSRVGGQMVRMHRFIIDAPEGSQVDHINQNKLDNRRDNLRLCSGAENSRNRPKQQGETTSRFKGVSWDSQKKKWRSFISAGVRRVHLGRFASEELAAAAYNQAARIRFGQFASLNDLPAT